MDGRDVFLVGHGRRRLLFHKSSLKLLGSHNLENAAMSCAAVALAFRDVDPSAGLAGLKPSVIVVSRWANRTASFISTIPKEPTSPP